MGKQQTARASGGKPAGSSESSTNPHENTARAVMRQNELPGWFWGLLGCLSVLGVGSAVLFFIFKPASATATVAPSVATTPAPIERGPPRQGAKIDIEPMAPPPASPGLVAAPKPKMAPHPIKIARSPAPAAAPAGESSSTADEDSDAAPKVKSKTKALAADSDDAPKAKSKTRASAADLDDAAKAKSKTKAPAADSDDDQAARAHKSPSSDDKSDDKEL